MQFLEMWFPLWPISNSIVSEMFGIRWQCILCWWPSYKKFFACTWIDVDLIYIFYCIVIWYGVYYLLHSAWITGRTCRRSYIQSETSSTTGAMSSHYRRYLFMFQRTERTSGTIYKMVFGENRSRWLKQIAW